MRTARPKATLLFTELEQSIYDDYVLSYKKDYSPLSPTDLIQLNDAATYHILAVRLAGSDIAQDRQTWNTRYHPKAMERAILDDLAMNRKQRLAKQPTTSTDEEDLRAILMGLSQNGHKR